jgi:antitoxin VapB
MTLLIIANGAAVNRALVNCWRLRRDVAFGKDVELIVRSGDVLTVYPAATSIPEMIARLKALPVPPSIERRDDEEPPARNGFRRGQVRAKGFC